MLSTGTSVESLKNSISITNFFSANSVSGRIRVIEEVITLNEGDGSVHSTVASSSRSVYLIRHYSPISPNTEDPIISYT